MLNTGYILDGKYEILKVLGLGGMGTVYLCKNNRLGNLWAVKEVNREWKSKIDFLAEPNLLKNLNHLGIVRIIDIFYEADNLYIVEDFIEGKTLKEHVDINGPMSSELVAEITMQLCSILDYLHNFNPPIIYRDLKPSNIMIKPDKRIVLIDFGIARTYKEGQDSDTIILGSRGYIAPEQLANVQSNVQTDIFSLGVTMYYMLTGKSINLPTELLYDENYPINVDKNLIRIIQKASAIEPKERYTNASLIVSELKCRGTQLIDSYDNTIEATKINLTSKKRAKKRTKFIIIALLACIITLATFISMLLRNNASNKKVIEDSIKTSEETVAKENQQQSKEVVEKDTIINGVLDIKKPIILNSGSSNGKSKGKNKDKNSDKSVYHVQFALNPAASISNSKLSVTWTHVEVIDDDIIAILSIRNTSEDTLKVDLGKTLLVNSKNETRKCYNPNSTNLLAIPKSSNGQELKLYFKDIDFEGSSYSIKTVLNSEINKDINLTVNIK